MADTTLGKPAGISLKEHTQNVVNQASILLKTFAFASEKYARLTDRSLKDDLLLAAKYHDWGKADYRWQNACQADYRLYRNWRIANKLSPDEINADDHRRFESEKRKEGEASSPNLLKAHFRHEFASLKKAEDAKVDLPEVVQIAIAAHHGKLCYRFEYRWKDDAKPALEMEGPFWKYWLKFHRMSLRHDQMVFHEILLQRYQFAAVRSLLQLADTRASRKEGEGENAEYDFKPFSFQFNYEPRPVQKAALEIANEPVSILRAPTGSGKTFASLLWAKAQIDTGKADRLVVAMPTRFTSNALAISVADEMGETGLYHSSAWHNRHGDKKERTERLNAMEAHRMAKYLATPVTVCTIDHLLICLTGVKEDHHGTFFSLANSCVVFDEADFYDPFVQANLVVLLDALRTLEVPVLIMSATVPDSARQLYKIEAPIKVPDELTEQNIKKLQWLGSGGEVDPAESIMAKMLDTGNGIIYANTVERAICYYDWLMENQPKEKEKVPLVMYHSRFTEPDKKEIEDKLISMIGKKAWEQHEIKPVRGIAIMTQIGEMSVNISSPIMLSDLCPWDRLAQRIGRLVRFGNRGEGICYVVEPIKDSKFYPAPYGEYKRGKEPTWEPVPAMKDTLKDLQEKFLEPMAVVPHDLIAFVNNLYPTVPDLDSHTLTNVKRFHELIQCNWLIQPNMVSNEDDGTVADRWTSRHIPPQVTVLTYKKDKGDELFFSDFGSFQNHILEFGVSCPMYLIEKEMRKGETAKLEKTVVKIEKREETMTVYRTTYYDENMGLSFLYGREVKPDSSGQIFG